MEHIALGILVPAKIPIHTARAIDIELEILMTNATFPLHNVDMTKVMADFNPAKIVDQFTKIASSFQIQQIDLDPIIVAQRKNIEALAAINQAATESL